MLWRSLLLVSAVSAAEVSQAVDLSPKALVASKRALCSLLSPTDPSCFGKPSPPPPSPTPPPPPSPSPSSPPSPPPPSPTPPPPPTPPPLPPPSPPPPYS